MALTVPQAVTRLLENEERLDKFLNSPTGYVTNETFPRNVPSVISILGRLGRQSGIQALPELQPNEVCELYMSMTNISSLLWIKTNYPAWVKFFGSQAAMIADRDRLITQSPDPSNLVIAEFNTTSNLEIWCCPIPIFNNMDNPTLDRVYFSFKNLDTVPRSDTLQIKYIGGAI